MKTTRERAKPAKIDWRRFDAMTEAQRHQAALNDPDARPLSDEDLARMKRRAPQLLPQRIDKP
jgi:putative transcriptional regulator